MRRFYRAVAVSTAAFMLMAGSVVSAEAELDDLFGNEITVQKEVSKKKITYVIDGFEFTCPPEYGIIYFDEVGPTIYISDAFQMRTVIRPISYEETVKDKEAMTAKALAAGAELTKEVTETEVDGMKVAFFRMNMEEDDMLAMICESPDPEKSFGGQLVVQNPNLKEEELLKIFTDVMKTAVKTDAPNSTREDIDEQVYAPEPIGEIKEESTLTHGNTEVTFKVDPAFYSIYTDECDMYAAESFDMEDYTTVDVFVYDELENFENAKEYITSQSTSYAEQADFEIETRAVNDHEFTCFAVQYPSEEDTMSRVFAACDLPSGGMYLLEAVRINGEEALSVDTILTFMEIQA